MADPTAAQRRMFAKMGIAMPDGSYYIRPDHPEDLTNAIRAVGRASGSEGTSDDAQRNAVRRHIMKRAAALKRTGEIPPTWNPDGTLKHQMTADDILEHFGVKGMHWGVHKSRSAKEAERLAVVRSTSSVDAKKATAVKEKVAAKGVHSLTNKELEVLAKRMRLEQEYSKLASTPAGQSSVKKGRNFVEEQTKTARVGINAIKTGRELAKILGPLIVAAAAGAAASKATGGNSGPVRMPQLAITSG
jgi:hypothetical protein